MTSLKIVEGIGPVYAQKLVDAGITTAEALLALGASPKGRTEIAEKTDISPKLILTWVNHVDLFRIKGVGEEYADLLEVGGEADGSEDEYLDDFFTVDISAAYKIIPQLDLFAEFVNVTDAPDVEYIGITDRPILQEYNNWWMRAGVKFSM